MRKASLGTLFLTVFLDLLGFGLVVPFLPGVARDLGSSEFTAALLGASFSFMQFICIPLWGRLSDRVGRRPVLLWSIAASAVGMAMLGFADTLWMLFVARIFSGAATANIAVAQAYIADVTAPDERARGMGMIGMGFGLGFIFGPFIGGELGRFPLWGREGALAALVAAALSLINFGLAYFTLPESLPAERRGGTGGRRWVPFDGKSFRVAIRTPGVGIALALSFSVIFWFSGMEQTFRLFTEDAFAMSVASTGRVFAVVGVMAVIVQGGLIHSLTRRFGEVRLAQTATVIMAVGFALVGASPSFSSPSGAWGIGVLYLGAATIAAGSGLHAPSVSSYLSRKSAADAQGMTLGAQQSVGALARVLGPIAGGLAYELGGMRAPYCLGALGMLGATTLALRLVPMRDSTARLG